MALTGVIHQFIIYVFSIIYEKNSFDDVGELRKVLLRDVDCSAGNIGNICPINGGWSDWSNWNSCIGECGQVGIRMRYRECTDPSPSEGGIPCYGSSHESIECRIPGCSEEDYEEMFRADFIRNQELKYLQKIHLKYPSLVERCLKTECHFSLVENAVKKHAERYWNALHCVKHNSGCPVFGGWSEWGKWSDCSAWCGKGSQMRCRNCDSPKPTYIILGCGGENCTTRSCQGGNCNAVKGGNWGSWNEWTSCSSTCGQGLRRRARKCSAVDWSLGPEEGPNEPNDFCNNQKQYQSRFIRQLLSIPRASTFCLGPFEEIHPCYLKSCSADGGWSEWEPWSQCSFGCGLGTQSRSRSCSSPVPLVGGRPCVGEFTSVRRCFIKPCQEISHQVADFTGNGSLKYLDHGVNTRLLHLYVRFRTFRESGTIISRKHELDAKNKKHYSIVKLSVIAGYLVFIAEVGKCHLSIVPSKRIELKKWTKVLIFLTGTEATLILNDHEYHYKKIFSCETILPNFKASMTVGANFTGQVARLYVNFLQRYLKKPMSEAMLPKNIYPHAIENVDYEQTTIDETFRDLDDLIFIPCSKNKYWIIEMIIKTTSMDGLLMLIKSSSGNMSLILSIEPRRVQLHLLTGEGAVEVFEVIEPHLGNWMHLKVEYLPYMTFGLSVNGQKTKTIRHYNALEEFICFENIMIGDVADRLKEHLKGNILQSINLVSLNGILSFVKIDNLTMDIMALPAEFDKEDPLISSEIVSSSAFYEEIQVAPGDEINLYCVYPNSHKGWRPDSNLIYIQWLKNDSPLNATLGRLPLTVHSQKSFSVLKIEKGSPRISIEGFYSCWTQNTNQSSKNIIMAYGVTVIDVTKEFYSSSRYFIKKTLMFSFTFVVITISWLFIEYVVCLRNGWGLFSSKTIRKRLRSPVLFEMSH